MLYFDQMHIGIAHFLLAVFINQRTDFARQGRDDLRPVGSFVFEVAPKGFGADLFVHPTHQKRFGGFPQVQIGIELAA